jgi:hypothetical protein
MAELHCDLREEQGAYCKILGLLSKCGSEIKTDLDLVSGENAHPYRTIDKWVSMFEEGRTNIRDDPRPWPQISATSEKDISTVKAIDKDARYAWQEISDLSGLSTPFERKS